MNQANKRHNSVLNPIASTKMQLLSPQKSSSTSNNSSSVQSSNIVPSNAKVPQYLQQHSLFVQCEPLDNNCDVYDSSDESDNNSIIKHITDLVDNKTVDNLSKSSNSEADEDYTLQEQIQYFSQFNTNKRNSDGAMFRQLQQFRNLISNNKQEDMYYNPNYVNTLNHNLNQKMPNSLMGNSSGSGQYINYPNPNMNTISPMKIAQWRQSQAQNQFIVNSNNINNFRRYSQLNPIPFALINNTHSNNPPQQQNNNILNAYMNSNASLSSVSPIGNQKSQNTFHQNFQKQIVDDQSFLQNILSLLKDQTGSRLVQEKLDAKKDDIGFLRKFYSTISTSLVKVINDNFGNYAMQKLIEILINQRQAQFITEFFLKIKDDLFNISVDNFGSRFFQKFLTKLINGSSYSHIETPELNDIIKQLIQKHLFGLCYDKNGNHVFQKILMIYPKDKNDFIFEELNKYAIDISKLQQNVVILQTVFKFAEKTQEDQLVNTILSVIDQLINDEYGNFLISYIVEHLVEDDYIKKVYEYISSNMMMLSQKKYSSNVIDKFIETPNNPYSLPLVNYINDNKLAKDMIVNEYGNYVIQKALKISDGKLFMSLIQQIEPMLESLMQLNIGRKIYYSLIQNYKDCFQNSKKFIASNQLQSSTINNNTNISNNSNNNSNPNSNSHHNKNKKNKKLKK